MKYPKVLIISHNVINLTSNMGKTLHDTFIGWPADKLCQLYLYPQLPSTNACQDYYRVTDVDIVNSLIKLKKPGKIIEASQISNDNTEERVVGAGTDNLYKKGRTRKPVYMLARNFIWSIGTWKTKELDQWIRKCSPDIIYFASGDYTFPYKITDYLSKKYNIPVMMAIYDDFYFSAKNTSIMEIIKNFQYGNVLKKMLKNAIQVSYASSIMKKKYDAEFDLNGFIQYKSAKINSFPEVQTEPLVLSYLGGLSLNRWKSLVDIGRCLQKIATDSKLLIDVYSTETEESIISQMIPENGINFHGGISADEVNSVIERSSLLLIVESFDEEYKERIECSLSTKVAESVASGRCIFAYGPQDVGAMDYLIQNDCAIVVSNKSELSKELSNVLGDYKLRKYYANKALRVAKMNHDADSIRKQLNENLSLRG